MKGILGYLAALFGLVLFSCPGVGWAQLPTEGLGLTQALDYAFAHNPEWAAEEAKVRQAEALIEAAGGWAAPKVKLQQAISPVQTRNGPQDQVLSFSQKVPFPGQNDLKVKRAKALYQAALFHKALKKRELIQKIKSTYFDLWLFEKLPDLLAESQEAVEKLADIRSIESQKNQNLLTSIFETQAAIGESAFALAQIRDEQVDAQAEFDRLLGRTGGAPIRSVQAPNMAVFVGETAGLIQRTLANHPKLKELVAKEQAAAYAAELAGNLAGEPDLEWGINYIKIGPSSNGAKDSGKDAYNLSLAMSLPWGNQTLGAKQAGAVAGAEVALSSRAAFEHTIHEQVSRHYNHVINAGRLVELFEQKVLPPARRAEQINRQIYGGGQSRLSLSIRSKAQLLNLEIKALKAKANYLKSQAALEAWTGPLDQTP